MTDDFIFDLDNDEECTAITLTVIKAVQHEDNDMNAISPEEYVKALKEFIRKIESGPGGTLFSSDVTTH